MKGLDAMEVALCDLLVDNDPFRLDSEYNGKNARILTNTVRRFGAEQFGDSHPTIIHPTEIVRQYVEDGGMWFFRAQNLRPLRVDETDKVFISEADAAKLAKNRLKERDVVMTRTGANRGDCALFASPDPAIASSHTFIIRSQHWSPAFLVAFFNSMYGKAQVDRGVYGAAQPEIAPYFLRNIWIPKVSDHFQQEIALALENAENNRRKSLYSVAEAEQSLLCALDLEDWRPPEPLTYTRRASDVFAAGRMDADYFAPRVDGLLKRLSRGGQTVGDVAPARR
ncbi:MAG: hypothetical protein GX571_03825, partial [Lentisphaerae bacterium]|nr:hypothetical protein [Lentisphaerota bacterium]